ncbi:MAG: MoaD family protein [Chloroflexi bacterium]|nr:MoaD family protein [Chloroflexota bacterium]
MMIRYFAMLRDATHRSEQMWDSPVSSLGELLIALCKSYGPEFHKWVVDEKGNLGGLSIILVNGTDYRHLGGLDAHLNENDVIAIFPPVAGG